MRLQGIMRSLDRLITTRLSAARSLACHHSTVNESLAATAQHKLRTDAKYRRRECIPPPSSSSSSLSSAPKSATQLLPVWLAKVIELKSLNIFKYCFTNSCCWYRPYGIVCLIDPLLQLRLLTHLKQDLIHSSIIRIIMYDFRAQLEGTGSRSEI